MFASRWWWLSMGLIAICGSMSPGLAEDRDSVRTNNSNPLFERIGMFRGMDGRYVCYRNPSLVVTTKGTILAFCEARTNDCNDWDDIDIVMRSSFDGGKSWSDMQVVVEDGEKTCGNQCPVVDRDTGTVWMPFCQMNRQIFVTHSTDDGATWSEPVEITSDVVDPSFDYIGTGPGHAIQLRSGRLLVPCWADMSAGPEGPVDWNPDLPTGVGAATKGKFDLSECSWVLYSDDHGRIWRRGGILDRDTTEECSVVETIDGSVYMNMRWFKKTFHRGYAWSKDGGETWSPVRFDDNLPDPRCKASLARLTDTRTHHKNRVLFANPDNRDESFAKARNHLTVRLSYDECRTWPMSKVIDPGPSGYSDLAVTPDKTILCIYNVRPQPNERGKTVWKDGSAITLARFNLEWLTDGADAMVLREL